MFVLLCVHFLAHIYFYYTFTFSIFFTYVTTVSLEDNEYHLAVWRTPYNYIIISLLLYHHGYHHHHHHHHHHRVARP